MRITFLSLIIFVFLACKNNSSEKDVPVLRAPLPDSTDVFYSSVEILLNQYNVVKENFVKEEDSSVIQSSKILLAKTDSLPTDLLQADSATINAATVLQESMSAELNALIKEINIEERRREFAITTEQLLELLKTTKYHRTNIYYFYCDKIFHDAGAGWIETVKQFKNPYDPSLNNCGVLRDSIVR